MRSHCALYVDVGYLLAAAATRVTGTSLRGGVVVAYGSLIDGLIAQAEQDSGLAMLRVNWYDSGGRPGGQADQTQETVGMLPKVKLRLGRRSFTGDQKGVDVRLGLDLATHGRNGVADVMYLVSGDDDLTEAVEEAQGHGVQVIVMAVPDERGRPHAIARHLQREADGVILVDAEVIDSAVRRSMPPPAASSDAPPPESTVESEPPSTRSIPTPADLARASRPDDVLRLARSEAPAIRAGTAVAWSTTTGDGRAADPRGVLSAGAPRAAGEVEAALAYVCRKVVASLALGSTEATKQDLTRGRPHIRADVDRTLLMDVSATLGVYELDERTRYELREHFWQVVDATF
ncbi:MAG: NYN domain-containing protein [Dermatophilaceae bacterium]